MPEGKALPPAKPPMASSSGTTSQTQPPLLALPSELKLQIISHLPHDEYPSHACLRRTHSSFYNLIPKGSIRSSVSEEHLAKQFLFIEEKFEYLLPLGHYPCYVCLKVLPVDVFPASLEHHFDDQEHPMYYWPRCCQNCEPNEVQYRISHLDLTRLPGILAPQNSPPDSPPAMPTPHGKLQWILG